MDIVIPFYKRIYTKKVLNEAKKAFSEVAKINIKGKGRYYMVEIECLEPEYSDIIAGVFANYCLARVAELRGSHGEEED